jgi:thioredoxin 1
MRLTVFITLCLLAIPAFGKSDPAAILDFTATWCGPCQSMNGIVESIKQDGIDIRTFDVDANKATAQRYSISNIPCFVVVDAKGHEIMRITGTTTKATLVALMRRSPAKPSGKCPYPAMVTISFSTPGSHVAEMASGTVVDRSGGMCVVITCAHGYTEGNQPIVKSQSGQRYATKILAVDKTRDVCILACQDLGVQPMKISSEYPKHGETVYMAGFAGDNGFMVTQGAVEGFTALDGSERTFLATTCLTDYGCSGGPLLNSRAELVGTVTCKDRKSGPGHAIGACLQVVLPTLKCKKLE